jgi:hypothetical protein
MNSDENVTAISDAVLIMRCDVKLTAAALCVALSLMYLVYMRTTTLHRLWHDRLKFLHDPLKINDHELC